MSEGEMVSGTQITISQKFVCEKMLFCYEIVSKNQILEIAVSMRVLGMNGVKGSLC